MEPIIIDKDQMTLLGFSFYGDPFRLSAGWTEENEIGRLWQRFTAYLDQHRHRIQHVRSDAVMYEVHIEHDETREKGEYEVFVGLEVERLDQVPVELTAKILPPTTYAIFSLHGKEITSDWPMIIFEWLSGSEYQRAHPYGFQRYDERFRGLEHLEESTLDVYVPVTRPDPPPLAG
jgi:predicted transcriptional regulator YdeE